jgi:LAO/AO transport system kinase
LRAGGEPTAVLAIDPSSPLTRGALLGDRLRVMPDASDQGLFVRSMASRGNLGGVAPAAVGALAVLERAGYTKVLVETVGIGQTGYDILSLADTVVAVFSPEAGDGLQLMKAGLIEIGDVFAVNKADRPDAAKLLHDIRLALQESHGSRDATPERWFPPVLTVTATTGEGIDALLQGINQHQGWLTGLPPTHGRRVRRVRAELELWARGALEGALLTALAGRAEPLAQAVLAGGLSVAEAAAELLHDFNKVWLARETAGDSSLNQN